jgi:hypothetical protein
MNRLKGKDPNAIICPVCMARIWPGTVIVEPDGGCEHTFHHDCLWQVSRTNQTPNCPKCNLEFTGMCLRTNMRAQQEVIDLCEELEVPGQDKKCCICQHQVELWVFAGDDRQLAVEPNSSLCGHYYITTNASTKF